MNTEKLIAKGIEKHFDGQKILFKVESLNEHFDGLQIHETDIIPIGEVGYVKCSDVNFDNATVNEVATEEVLIEEIEVVAEEVVAEMIPTEELEESAE